MFVVVLKIELFFPQSGSLKSKRAALRPIKAALHQRLHLAVSEVDGHDTWQRATLAASLVAGSASAAQDGADRVVRWLDANVEPPPRVDRIVASWRDLGGVG